MSDITRIIKVGIPGPAGTKLGSVTLSDQELIFTNTDSTTLSSGNLYFTKYDAGVIYPHPTYTVNSAATTINITIPTFSAALYSQAYNIGPCLPYSISQIDLDIPPNKCYVIVDYNSGSPTVSCITDVTLINESNIIPVYTFENIDDTLHAIHWDALSEGLPNKLHYRIVKTNRFAAVDDFSLTTTNQYVEIGANTIFVGATPIDTAAVTSSNATLDNTGPILFMNWYKKTDLTWDIQYHRQYTNNFYNPSIGGLVTLSNNKYTVAWIYRDVDLEPHAAYVLDDEEFNSLAEANNTTQRTDLPDAFGSHAILVGKIIFQKGSTIGTAFPVVVKDLIYTNSVNHNDLANIYGSAEGYHLSSNSYSNVTSSIPTFSSLTLTNVPTYADNATAILGGLTLGNLYSTSIGQLMIVY